MFVYPPQEIKRFIYNCGKTFDVDYINSLFIPSKKRYGVIQIYGEDSIIQVCDENAILKTLNTKSTKLQRRHGRGGQSQNRIARLRDESIHEYLKSVGEKINSAYITDGVPNVTDVLILGHGLKKSQIIEYRPETLQNLPINVESKPREDPITPYLQRFIDSRVRNEYSSDLQEIETLLQSNPDLLVFGAELTDHAAEIKKIYDTQDVLARFGGPVGVRYYSIN